MKKTTLGTWIVRFIFCIAVIATYKMFDNLLYIFNWVKSFFNMLTPFIIGGAIAFLLFPICKKVEVLLSKTKKPFIVKRTRGLATLIVVIFALMVISAVLLLLVPMIYNSIVDFISAVPEYLTDVYNFLSEHIKDTAIINEVINDIKNYFSFENIAKFFTSLDYNSYLNGITSVFSGVFNTLIGAIISVYLLLDRKSIKKMLIRIGYISLKPKKIKKISEIASKIAKVIYTFIFGQMLDAFIIASCIGVILSLFGINNSIVLAIVYFLFALIPYFGSIIGVISVFLLSLVSGNIQQCLMATVIALLMQQLDTNVVNPKVVGHVVGIRPLYVILGITLFGGMFGFVGFFLGPPLMSIVIELFIEFIKLRENKKNQACDSLAQKGIIARIKDSVSFDEDFKNTSSDLEDIFYDGG